MNILCPWNAHSIRVETWRHFVATSGSFMCICHNFMLNDSALISNSEILDFFFNIQYIACIIKLEVVSFAISLIVYFILTELYRGCWITMYQELKRVIKEDGEIAENLSELLHFWVHKLSHNSFNCTLMNKLYWAVSK